MARGVSIQDNESFIRFGGVEMKRSHEIRVRVTDDEYDNIKKQAS